MQITVKLYAMLSDHLPATARRNTSALELTDSASVADSIRQLGLPPDLVHLVLVNGVYIPPEQLADTPLHDGDVLAIWPPVAGG